GPGPAVSPREQGECLFELLGKAPKFKQVPVRLLDSAIWTLSNAGRILPKLSEKADFARIAKYYATESMLVLNQATGLYDSDLTPSTGEETLFEHYAKVVSGEAIADLGEHSMF
ncbi:MAG: epimerase, partial [Pseudomonadota bacterium]